MQTGHGVEGMNRLAEEAPSEPLSTVADTAQSCVGLYQVTMLQEAFESGYGRLGLGVVVV